MGELEVLATWIDLDGCFNFRDLGGYRTADGRHFRTGIVFRSDGLHLLSAADLEKLAKEIKLGHVIDLRSQEEVEEVGRGAIADQTETHHVPLFAGVSARSDKKFEMPEDMGDLYFMMLTFGEQPIVEVIRLLSEVREPAVFHCAAGKDRTGVISAVLLSLVGVPEETIVADYAFSRQNLDRINERLGQADTYQRFMNDLPEGASDADPACMEGFLSRVRDRHGSMDGWAKQAGLDEALIERLRQKLLG